MREFPLATVLTVTTRMMLCGSFADIQEIQSYLIGINLFTHQLPAAQEFCASAILLQHPELSYIEKPCDETRQFYAGEEGYWRRWVSNLANVYGSTISLAPVPGYVETDPIQDLIHMMHPDQELVIVEVR